MIEIKFSPVKQEILAQNVLELTMTSEDGEEPVDLRLTYLSWDDLTRSSVRRLRIEQVMMGGQIKLVPSDRPDAVLLDL